ncbi:hypothetical protein NP493_48g07061 [Ridgeia piscesae]|uniref:Uncharacterized protein n=1 Tax=Ridgeia piscesae TaxID=27915 RepID=A0AAD9PBU8_RIDPI|nr:hypothetical protein NP493_48g07061 [Ridgeia piscesae]
MPPLAMEEVDPTLELGCHDAVGPFFSITVACMADAIATCSIFYLTEVDLEGAIHFHKTTCVLPTPSYSRGGRDVLPPHGNAASTRTLVSIDSDVKFVVPLC